MKTVATHVYMHILYYGLKGKPQDRKVIFHSRDCTEAPCSPGLVKFQFTTMNIICSQVPKHYDTYEIEMHMKDLEGSATHSADIPADLLCILHYFGI